MTTRPQPIPGCDTCLTLMDEWTRKTEDYFLGGLIELAHEAGRKYLAHRTGDHTSADVAQERCRQCGHASHRDNECEQNGCAVTGCFTEASDPEKTIEGM